jgi:N-methylhydantoinase A
MREPFTRRGCLGGRGVHEWTVEARYPDQAWEIEVPLRRSRFDHPEDIATFVEDFHATHQNIFASAIRLRR